jgi:ATP/maltotriose-dependent transcriptional regulator MalT
VFACFAAETLRKADAATRQFLLRTAFLPRMTAAMAERLTGIPDGERTLLGLAAENFFTERSQAREPV